MRLQRFYIPIYHDTRGRPWQLRVGLSLYALLSGFGRGAAFGTLPRSQWQSLDGLERKGLQQVFYYHDAQTDDRALTEAVVRSAQQLGVRLLCPAQVQRAAVSGVNLDSQAALLLQFQTSYDAVSKVVTTLNNLTDALLNIMPVAS